jgi:hypothetical protein
MLSWGVYSHDSVLSIFEHDKLDLLTDSNRLHHSKPYSDHNIDHHHGHLTSGADMSAARSRGGPACGHGVGATTDRQWHTASGDAGGRVGLDAWG